MRLFLVKAAAAVVLSALSAVAAAQASLPPEVARGRDWLVAQVAADGHLATGSLRLATERQAEAEAIETLQYLGTAPAALVQRHGAAQLDAGLEHLARRVIALTRAGKPVQPLLAELRSQQNADGGFGGSRGHAATLLDTSFALIALRVAGVTEGTDVARAVDYLVARVGDSARGDWQSGPNAKPYVSAYALLALQMHSVRYPIAAAVAAQRAALVAQQGNGRYAEVLLDTVAALALQYGTTGESGLAELRSSIRAAQAADGSWAGDSFLTSLALRALASSVLPPPSTDGRIVLRVRDAVTLAYLPGARLTLAERPELVLASGADGRIDSGALVPGSYSLALSKDGYRNRDLGTVSLIAGQTRDLGTLDLGRDPGTAVLFGRVTDVSTTAPLAGVAIEVSGALQANTTTAPDGSFEMVFTSGGVIQVRASRSGYQAVTGNGTLVVGQSLRFSPALYPDGTQVPGDASLVATVVDATSDAPIAGAKLMVGTLSASSDANGRVQLDGLPVGTFTASVGKLGYRAATLSGSLVAGANDAGMVRLVPDAVAERSSLSGRVTDASNGVAIGGATVSISGTELRATTDSNGNYAIANIDRIPFTAIATAPGYATQQVSAGADAHANFQASFAMQKLASAEMALESVVMSAPEYDPFTEIGVLGTVKNLSTSAEVGVIFNAVVSDASGRVVRDVPLLQSTLNRSFDDTIIRFAPGETKPITIVWGSLNDAPGEYSVLFRGATPDGRVVLEGPASYRIRSVTRVGGGILTDPPLIQAGTGQSVALGADLTNMGNQPIPAGSVKLSITLAAKDDRPPLPAKPSIGANLISGTPLNSPIGLARDTAGNVYTLNTGGTPSLVKVGTDGVGTTLRALPTKSPSNATLSTPLSLQWRAPNLLRVAWISGWIADIDLSADNAVSNFVAPPSGVDANSVTAYTHHPASNDEYFGVLQATRPRVLQRNAAGQVSMLIDAGLNQGGAAQVGPDGKLYVLNLNPGAVFRIDPATRAIEALWVGLGNPRGLMIDAAGTIYVTETSPTARLQRRLADGSTTVLATFVGYTVGDLQLGRDGLLYGAGSDGTIRRFDANGANTIWARGILTGVQGVALDAAGGIYAHNGSAIRYLAPDNTLQVLGSAAHNITSLMPDGPDGPLMANGTSMLRVVGSGYQTLLTPVNNRVRLLAPFGSDVLLATLDGTRPVLARSDRSSFQPLYASPFGSTVRDLEPMVDGSLVVVNGDSVVRIAADGTHTLVARIANVASATLDRAAGQLWVNSPTEGLLRIALADGSKTKVRNYISTLQYDFAISATGALVYSDYSARKIISYDPVANTFTDLHVFASGLNPQELALSPEGTLYVRFANYTFQRFDGPGWVVVDSTYVYEVLHDANGRVGYRKNQSIFMAPAAGATSALRSVLVESPDRTAWLTDDAFAAYHGSRTQLKLLNAAGASLRNVYGISTPVALAATDAGDVYVLDAQKDLARISGDTLTRLGRFTSAFDMRARGAELWLTQSDGFHRLQPDNSTVRVATVPGWAVNQYGGFGTRGAGIVVYNRSTEEIVRLDAGTVAARYQPFASPTALLQRADGSWLVGSAARVVAVRADAQQSEVFSQVAGTTDLLMRRDGGVLAAINTELVQALDANGTATTFTGPLVSSSIRMNYLAEGANGQLFAIGHQGLVYRQENDWLVPFAAGVTRVNSILRMNAGGIVVSSEASASLLEHKNGVTTGVASLLEGPRAMCALDADTLAVIAASYLYIVDVHGGVNFAGHSGIDPVSIGCGTGGEMFILGRSPSRIVRASAGVQQAGVQVGDVVREQIVPMAALSLEGGQHLDFNSWIPPEGGDYEIRVVPLDPAVEGSLLTGIHVGPAAAARMTVSPSSVVPGDAEIAVQTQLEGADFTRLARIDRSQLRLAGNSVYPNAMSLDPSGRLWYSYGSAIYRAPIGSTVATRVGTVTTTSFRGELPIDSLGRAYIAPYTANKYFLRRIDDSGAGVNLTDFGSTAVVSMTIDNQDRLYVLTSDNKVYLVLPDGSKSLYVALPGTTPFGITRDGAGGVYVQQHGNRILYVSPTLEVNLMDLRGAVFEYEGVNIAGDCGEGMFMTPMSLPGTGQSGEEHTVVQLVGRTGEIGTVINGRVISQDLVDMDFITYDRFGSRLLIMSESNGNKLYTVPVTCGAIDIDLHVVLAAGQPHFSSTPQPDAAFPRDNGDIEYVWSLRDVNRQGATVATNTKLFDLVRGEDRPAVREAFAMLKNSFQPQPVRLDIDVPTVHVRDLVDLAVVLDREEYPQNTPVGIRVPMVNSDNVAKSGRLVVWVEDAAGARLETLVEREQAFAPRETIELTPPFNSGTLRVGGYRVVAEIRDALGGVVARASDDFRVVAGSGAPTLVSTVATDKPVYLVGEAARIFANVLNQSANLGFSQLVVSERVLAAGGAAIYSHSLPLANLEPAAQARLQFDLSLAGVPAGFYDVQQEVRSATGELLDSRTTRFEVRSLTGTAALSGSVAVEPLRVRRGRPAAIAAGLQHRGDVALAGVESILRVIAPGSTTVLAEWRGTHDLAAGASVAIPAEFDTANRELRDYLVVLSARVGGEERALAQKPFWIEDVVFSGTLSADPVSVVQGNDTLLAGSVSNSGNLAAIGSTIRLVVADGATGQVVREWSYPADIAAGATRPVSQSLNTLPLALGSYQARLSVLHEGREQALSQASFTVLNYRIAGTFAADPSQVRRGDPVDLTGVANNSGNLGIDPLPLRIEVIKLDTQATVLTLDDTTALAPDASYTMLRRADTTGFVPGHYEGVFSAYFAGQWHELATDPFEVVRPIEVEIGMDVPRDARVLVLMSCSQHQAQQLPVSGGHAQTVCEQQRRVFLSQYLTERGIEHKIVLDQDSFMHELRCGRYNVFWFSGGAVKLGVAETIEVRESIFRGDGYIVEGDNDQRNSQFDEMLGHLFRGHHSRTDLAVTGSASLFPAVTVPSYGRALKLELTTGTVEARFDDVGAPAIIGASYGQGRALSYGFDLVEALRRDGTQPATERLLLNALVRVAPLPAAAGYLAGAYVPVTTTVQNRGDGFDARLETRVDAPAAIISSRPQATEGDATHSAWNFALQEGERLSFDANVLTGGAASTLVRSVVFERSPEGLLPLGNAQISLTGFDSGAATSALLDGLRTAALAGGEAAARERALRAIDEARTAQAAGQTDAAIDRWLDAVAEVRRITTVSHAEWRLALARLLALTQRSGCSDALQLCGTTPTAATRFDPASFRARASLGRAQAGGTGQWEWQLGAHGAAFPVLRADLDWSRNQDVDFLIEVDATGRGQLELRQGGVLKAQLATDPALHGTLLLGDALQLVARNTPDVGQAQLQLRALSLDGAELTDTLQSGAAEAIGERRLSFYRPALKTGFKLRGTARLQFTGNAPPQGARLEFEVMSGHLLCNGGGQ